VFLKIIINKLFFGLKVGSVFDFNFIDFIKPFLLYAAYSIPVIIAICVFNNKLADKVIDINKYDVFVKKMRLDLVFLTIAIMIIWFLEILFSYIVGEYIMKIFILNP
jgi:hypothetical protein